MEVGRGPPPEAKMERFADEVQGSRRGRMLEVLPGGSLGAWRPEYDTSGHLSVCVRAPLHPSMASAPDFTELENQE